MASRRLCAVRARSGSWGAFIWSWATSAMTGSTFIFCWVELLQSTLYHRPGEGGGEAFILYNQLRFRRENTLISDAANHGILW